MDMESLSRVFYPKDCRWFTILLDRMKVTGPVEFLVREEDVALKRQVDSLATALGSHGGPFQVAVVDTPPELTSQRQGFPVICHTAEEVSRDWGARMIIRLREEKMHSGLRLSVANDGDRKPDDFVLAAEIDLWGSGNPPDWEAYDSIDHFLPYGWPHFEVNQKKGAKSIFDTLLKFKNLSEVHDVGCGSGEVLMHLAELYKAAHSNVPALSGYDPSACQVEKAATLLGGTATVRRARLEDVSVKNPKNSAVLFLGNTLAHIGARAFRNWLVRQGNALPRVVLIDFATDWRSLLRRATPEIVCGSMHSCTDCDPRHVFAHMTTAGGPGWVKRGIVLDFAARHDATKAGNTIPDYSHRLFTKQYADEPGTYEHILQARGYVPSGAPMTYSSGWGEHELQCYERGTVARIAWPEIADAGDSIVCDLWYEELCRCWGAVETRAPFPFKLFPAAIVPFCNERVYARYVRSGTVPQGADQLFHAWMWVVDPKKNALSQAGATKTEDILPYAPSIYRAMLGSCPSPLLESLDSLVDELRLDLNASDMELADLERRWILDGDGHNDGTAFYGIPVYARGLPCFLVLVRVGEFTDAGSVFGSCRLVARRIGAIISRELGEAFWERFVRGLHTKSLPANRVTRLVENVTRDRKWTSWLDSLPGEALHKTSGQTSLEFKWQFDAHNQAVRSIYHRSADELQIGVLCALDEEFKVVIHELEGAPVDDGLFSEHRAREQLAGGDVVYRIWCVEDMSQTPTAVAATMLCMDANVRSHLNLLVLLGISASLKDCVVGDVLVASLVDHYAAAMEAVKADDSWDVNFGGKPYYPSRPLAKWCDSKFSKTSSYQKWQEKGMEWAKTATGDKWADLEKLLGGHVLAGLVGTLASGNIVAKCEAFRKKIKERERNYKALDMESAGFMEAVERTEFPNSTLVIRGISDPGDESKRALEDLFHSKLREWAVVNALSYLRGVISEAAFREAVFMLDRKRPTVQ